MIFSIFSRDLPWRFICSTIANFLPQIWVLASNVTLLKSKDFFLGSLKSHQKIFSSSTNYLKWKRIWEFGPEILGSCMREMEKLGNVSRTIVGWQNWMKIRRKKKTFSARANKISSKLATFFVTAFHFHFYLHLQPARVKKNMKPT